MPHVHISHFPKELDDERRAALVAALTDAVAGAFETDKGAVSIALEPVDASVWKRRVYDPEITGRSELLVKAPSYAY
jgi:4-oxalocrotonate tautomerase